MLASLLIDILENDKRFIVVADFVRRLRRRKELYGFGGSVGTMSDIVGKRADIRTC